MPIAFIGLGSNLEPRQDYLLNGLKILKDFVRVHKVSSIYETEPWGNPDLFCFYNAVAKVETSYAPDELLNLLLQIEKQMGRIRTRKWENRTLDLDLLDYEQVTLHQSHLTLPHPHISERSFVVIPWFEIEPEWVLSNNIKIKDLYFQRFYALSLKCVLSAPVI